MRRRVPINRVCYSCGINTSFDGKTEHWYRNHPTSLYLCKKCFHNYVYNPIVNPINRNKTICFKGRDIVLKQPPRKHICSWCDKQGTTVIHHIQYHEEDPLEDTVEICVSCHIKEHWKRGDFVNSYGNRQRDPITGRFL